MIQPHLQPGSVVQVEQGYFAPRSWDGLRLSRTGEPAQYACLIVKVVEDEDGPEYALERVLDGAKLVLAADYFTPGAISQH